MIFSSHILFKKLFVFLTTGGASFFVGFVFLYVFQAIFHFPYLVSVPLSAVIAATVHYEASRRFVFNAAQNHWLKGYISFMSITVFVIALITFGVFIGVEFLRMNVYSARILVAIIVAVLSFFIHQRYTFKPPAS